MKYNNNNNNNKTLKIRKIYNKELKRNNKIHFL